MQSESPEINTGCLIVGFNDRGKWDYKGSNPDIGAFEYTGVPNLNKLTFTVNPLWAYQNEEVSFTIELINTGGPLTTTASMTDILPAGISLTGLATATLGEVSTPNDTTVTWHGILGDVKSVRINFQARVTTDVPATLTNTIDINDGLGSMFHKSSTYVVNPWLIYLPILSQ